MHGDCKFIIHCCIANTQIILVFRGKQGLSAGIGHSATTQRKTSVNEQGGSVNAPAKVQHECNCNNNNSSNEKC